MLTITNHSLKIIPSHRLSFGLCGRFTIPELVSFSLSVSIVCIWILTGHWLLMDAMGMGLCVAFIAFVRLPSLKVSTLLLMGLLIYDVFWVFFSSYIFNSNVMVRVATRPAENPVNVVAKRFHLSSNNFVSGGREPPKLSLPGKLIFPSMNNNGHFSMLGLGDIVSYYTSPYLLKFLYFPLPLGIFILSPIEFLFGISILSLTLHLEIFIHSLLYSFRNLYTFPIEFLIEISVHSPTDFFEISIL